MFLAHVLPEDRARVDEAFRLALERHGDWAFECRIRRADGQVRWIHAAGRHRPGRVPGSWWMSGIVQDIDDRKRTEEALRAREELFRVMFMKSSLGKVQVDLASGRFLRVNPSFCRLTGFTEAELLERSFLEITHPDDRESDAAQLASLARGEVEGFESEKRFVRPDGSMVWGHVTVNLLRDAAGRPLHSMAAVQDVSERKQSEARLTRLNRTLRAHNDSIQALMRAEQEGDYLQQVCRIIVGDCGYRGVSVGLAERDPVRSLRQAAFAGSEEGSVEPLETTWADGEEGSGPAATAVRTGRVAACRNVLTDPGFVLRRDEALRRGYASAIAFPLKSAAQTLGALTIYSGEADPFSGAEEALLARLAEDLSFGLASLRQRAAHRSAQEALDRAARKYSTMFNATSDGVWTLDLQGRVLEANDAFCRMTGYTRDELLRLNASALEAGGLETQLLPRVGQLSSAGGHDRFESRHRRKDGTVFDVDVAALRLELEGGQVALFVRDITDRKRDELALRKAMADAEGANKSKDEFLAVLSHELRTPLTSMLGWVRMMQHGVLDAETARTGLDVIERNVRSQTRLIEDLLDISRIIAGKMGIERRAVDLTEVARLALESARPSAAAKRLRLEEQIEGGSLLVDGDAARLQQVVWNLLANAIKFTPDEGTVRLTLGVRAGRAVLTVADTGCGIGPGFLPRLFDHFSQEDSSSSRRYSGLGLGLAIVRHLVGLHGGEIAAASEGEGCGATFTVTVPLRPEQGLVAAPRRTAVVELPQALAGVRVLVVDDNRDVLDFLTQALRVAGAEVITAASAGEALDAVERSHPVVMVCDIGLPGDDGCALLEKVRERARAHGASAAPAIALTGYAQAEDVERTRAAGFLTHLAKPVEPEVLIRAVANLRSGFGPRASGASAPARTPAA
ncbi:MAG: PAS domain S-box protein [Myxococcales bacterium]